MELKYFIRLLISPSYWMMNELFYKEWDNDLIKEMATNKFTNYDGYNAKLGPLKMWVVNHPYSSFVDRSMGFRPSRFTLMKCRDKFINDIRPGGMSHEWQKGTCDSIEKIIDKISPHVEDWWDEFIEEVGGIISKIKINDDIPEETQPEEDLPDGYKLLPLDSFPNCCGKCKFVLFNLDLIFCKRIKTGNQRVSIFGKCKKFRTK